LASRGIVPGAAVVVRDEKVWRRARVAHDIRSKTGKLIAAAVFIEGEDEMRSFKPNEIKLAGAIDRLGALTDESWRERKKLG
jgi:hypothetical protein